MRRLLAGLPTIALLGLLLWSDARRPASTSAEGISADRPDVADPAEERIAALLERARRGDVAGYLASFRGRLEREVEDRGRDVHC